MKLRLASAGLACAALLASPAAADDEADILAAAQSAFAPYQSDAPWTAPDWDMPIYSSETTALIREWEAGLSDEEPEELNDFSWLCQCQDSDPEKFRVELEPFHAKDTDASTVEARVDLGWDGDETAESELYMLRENGRWMLDDIVSESFPKGLKAALRAAIEAHKSADANPQAGAD